MPTTRCECGKPADLTYLGTPICRGCWHAIETPFDDDNETKMRGERTDRYRYREDER